MSNEQPPRLSEGHGGTIIKTLIVIALLGSIGYGGMQIGQTSASIKNHNAAITNLNAKMKTQRHNQKTVVKRLPSTYQQIHAKATTLMNAEIVLSQSKNQQTTQAVTALQTIKQLVSNYQLNWDARTTPWLGVSTWHTQIVFSGASANGNYPVGFYMTDAHNTPMQLITTTYYDGQFHNASIYLTGAGNKAIEAYNQKIKGSETTMPYNLTPKQAQAWAAKREKQKAQEKAKAAAAQKAKQKADAAKTKAKSSAKKSNKSKAHGSSHKTTDTHKKS